MNLEASGRQSVRASALLSALRSRKVLDACKLLVCAALLVAAAGAQPAADWTIDTIAGNVYRGDGGQATATQLYFPYGVAVDGSGNIYIASVGNNCIRKVDTAGIITTVAGNGEQGYSGDGGAATAAKLFFPYGVTVDGSGNLYIVDTGNNRIRKVTASTGIITTVAGSGARGFGGDGGSATATAAKLNWPRGVAVDGSGNIYIADAGNHRVRKVDATTRNISTVAGDGTSGFGGDGGSATDAAVKLNNPWDVALDGDGNLYIADAGNYRIRQVDTDGNIATFAGNGSASCCNDGNPATMAGLGRPLHLALDGSNNLYIVANISHQIRKVTASTGIITTIAGGTNRGFNGDGGLATATLFYNIQGVAVDGSGNLYFVDFTNQRIRRVDAVTKIVSTVAGGATGDGGPATAAHLNSPRGVEADGAGNFYIADALNYRIRKIDAAGNISTVAGNGTNGFSGDGDLATLAQLRHPVNTALDGDGNLYIADAFSNRIRKVDADGNISTIAGIGRNGFGGDGNLATLATLHYPWDVALDGSDNLYIADRDNRRIRMIDADSKIISTVAGDGTRGDGGDGDQATAAQLNSPHGVAVDGDGNLYIADSGSHRVRKVDADGDISTVAGDGTRGFSGDGGQATAAQLNYPYSLALDGDGNLYIADRNNYRIRWVNADTGIIATVAGTGARGFSKDGGLATQSRLYGADGVAVDGAGYIYIGDTSSHRIRRVGPPPPPAPPAPPAPPREPEPAVRARTFKLAFALRQDDAPAAQEVVLYAENGAVDFRAQPAQRWISVEPASGSLEEDEETVVTVTVDPAGLGVGRREGRVYIRSGGRVTTQVRLALTVRPAAGPAVSQHGVVNAAVLSAFGERGLFGPRLLPVAPGSLVVVRGENFTGGEAYAAESFPLPASLGGVSVQFDGLQARLLSVGPQRIEAQAPSLLGMEALEAGGTALATVVVETAEGGSYPRRFTVAAHAPGVFTASGAGTGQAAALLAGAGALAAPRGAASGQSRPARAGDVLEIYATGLGPVEPPLADGENSCAPQGVCLNDFSNVTLRRTLERPRVSIGGVEVAADGVLFSGLAPALAAVNVVLVEVPAGIAPSDAAEVVIAIGGRTSQPGVTIAVE